VKVAGHWTYLYRAVEHHGQVIDVLVSDRRDGAAAPVYPRVIDEVAQAARHVLEQYANNRVEADHGRIKARLRPMRGLKTPAHCALSRLATHSCRTCSAATTRSPPDVPAHDRVRVAFTDLARCL
jgi:transposase-like protein